MEIALGQFVRVRITRAIFEPLRRCVNIAMEGEEDHRIVLIRYERLPDFCYACGRVGHVVRHCHVEGVNKLDYEFGQWLRASRVLEARRQRYGPGPADNREWREFSEASHGPTDSGLQPKDSGGSKDSAGKNAGQKEVNTLQMVLAQNAGSSGEIGCVSGEEVGAKANGVEMEETGERQGQDLQKEGEIRQPILDPQATNFAALVDGKIDKGGANGCVGQEKR